jgi:hypothetical protein
MNRARMRRMLCHVAVDWDNIQMDVSISSYGIEDALMSETARRT